MLSTVSEYDRVVSSTQENVRTLDCVSSSKIFLLQNNLVVLKDSTELAETLFIALTTYSCQGYVMRGMTLAAKRALHFVS